MSFEHFDGYPVCYGFFTAVSLLGFGLGSPIRATFVGMTNTHSRTHCYDKMSLLSNKLAQRLQYILLPFHLCLFSSFLQSKLQRTVERSK